MSSPTQVFEQPYGSPFGCLIVEVLIMVGGALFLLPFHRGWGILLILATILLLVLATTAETRYTITRTPAGFTVTAKKRLGRTRRTTYRWNEVRATRYREISTSRSALTAAVVAYFSVFTDRGRAFEVRKIPGSHFQKVPFDTLIEDFNTMTPQLPYVWHYQGPGSTRMWRYGFDRYHKVDRNALRPPPVSGGDRRERLSANLPRSTPARDPTHQPA